MTRHRMLVARLSRAHVVLAGFGIGVILQAAVATLANAADAPTAAPAANSFVVRNVRVFDGERTIADTDVVVRDGRIAAIGRGAKADGLRVVDGSKRTLLPGLIDAHVHTWGSAREEALRFGVTTELDMFSDWHQLADAKRQRVSFDRTTKADLWSAGTLATVPGGHGTEYGFTIPTLTTPAEAPNFVDARLAEGSDYLKIILEDGSAYGRSIPSLDEPTLSALVVAAHARKLLAVAHVATQADAQHAVAAHVDGLAHVFLDEPAEAATVAAFRKQKTFVVATLSVAATLAGAGEGAKLAVDPRIRPFLAAEQVRVLDAAFPTTFTRASFLANATESVRRLHAAGVTILAGTDAGNPGTTHGATLHEELALLVAAGLSPSEALSAATALPAQRFALGDRGRIAPGLRADLLLVDGDPTQDVTATRAIDTIWKNGYVVDRSVPVAAPAAAAVKPVPADPLIADFEDGAIAVRYGQNWIVTTDQLIGGKSTATQTWIAGGADGSKGALRVSGTVAPGAIFAWAGTLFMPGSMPFEPIDFSSRTTLVFKVRGDARDYTAMLFSGPPSNGQPATARFKVTPEWTEVRIPFARFLGADLSTVKGLAFTAGAPVGDFTFEIDDVSVR
jgi:imidazolonepropionase-like amidohydrolase